MNVLRYIWYVIVTTIAVVIRGIIDFFKKREKEETELDSEYSDLVRAKTNDR